MKLQINMVVSGNDSIARKFLETINIFPTVNVELVRAFAQTLTTTFRFSQEDNLNVEYFSASPVVEAPPSQDVPVVENKENVPEKAQDEKKDVES